MIIIFFILFNTVFFSSEKSTLIDRLKYLSEKKIIDNIKIDEKSSTSNEEFIKALYNILSYLEKDKVSKEDLKLIESMLYSLNKFLNNLSVEFDKRTINYIEDRKNLKNYKLDISNVIKDISHELENLKESLNKSSLFEEEKIIKFFKKYKFNFYGDFSIFNDLSRYNHFELNTSIYFKAYDPHNSLKIYASNNKDSFEKHYNVKINLFHDVEFLILNYNSKVESFCKDIIIKPVFNNLNLNLRNKNFRILYLEEEKGFNLFSKIHYKYLFYNSNLYFLERNFENLFLELGFDILFNLPKTYLRFAYKNYNFKNFMSIYLKYKISSINLKTLFKNSFEYKNPERDIKSKCTYELDENIFLGGNILIDLTTYNFNFKDKIKAWEVFVKSKREKNDFLVSFNFRKTLKISSKFVVFKFKRSFSNFDVFFNTIFKDSVKSRICDYLILVGITYKVNENISLNLSYILSNFNYFYLENDILNSNYKMLRSKFTNKIGKKTLGEITIKASLKI